MGRHSKAEAYEQGLIDKGKENVRKALMEKASVDNTAREKLRLLSNVLEDEKKMQAPIRKALHLDDGIHRTRAKNWARVFREAMDEVLKHKELYSEKIEFENLSHYFDTMRIMNEKRTDEVRSAHVSLLRAKRVYEILVEESRFDLAMNSGDILPTREAAIERAKFFAQNWNVVEDVESIDRVKAFDKLVGRIDSDYVDLTKDAGSEHEQDSNVL